MGMDMGNTFLTGVVILLIILFFVSFMLFIRRSLINQRSKANNNLNMERKLDRIIELLENEENVGN